MCAVSFKRHILMLFCQLVNVVAETVGIPVLSDNVGVSMCVLRSFAVFVIIIVTIFFSNCCSCCSCCSCCNSCSCSDDRCQTVSVAAETVDISVLQGRFVSVCVILRSFAVSCIYPYKQKTHYSILSVLGRVCVVE